LLPPLLGGGFGGMTVIITSEIELSSITMETSGLLYGLRGNILSFRFFKLKTVSQKYETKIAYLK
jgi:hypothetical protein